ENSSCFNGGETFIQAPVSGTLISTVCWLIFLKYLIINRRKGKPALSDLLSNLYTRTVDGEMVTFKCSSYFTSMLPSNTFSAGPQSQMFSYFSSSVLSNSTESVPPNVFTSISLKPFSLW